VGRVGDGRGRRGSLKAPSGQLSCDGDATDLGPDGHEETAEPEVLDPHVRKAAAAIAAAVSRSRQQPSKTYRRATQQPLYCSERTRAGPNVLDEDETSSRTQDSVYFRERNGLVLHRAQHECADHVSTLALAISVDSARSSLISRSIP